ncbi:MAG: phospholipase [Streptosporangiaceae bacterium]|nr:phospholipase [Streptosporangiaceae bacterium]
MRISIAVRSGLAAAAVGALALAGTSVAQAAPAHHEQDHGGTKSPIKHVVVLYQENVSFDHYFGTYPKAANTDGQPFHAKKGTPAINGLSSRLLTHNPNKYNPSRLGPAQAVTCDQDHDYAAEQKAFNGGKMDKFVENTNVESCTKPMYSAPGLVMDYYDGNTVTGLWNYAQRFSMSDNSYNTTFGPSTPGALNLVSGQTHGGIARDAKGNAVSDAYAIQHPDAANVGTVTNDPQPYFDDCSNHARSTVEMTGKNVGDMLNAKGVSWGWFQGGFKPSSRGTDGTAACATTHNSIAGLPKGDYIPHHEPFQYYKSTSNPRHTAPASVAEIGHNGQANHQYDMSDWYTALGAGNLPAVSYLKASGYQDGHAGYSDPIDEQHFVVDAVNRIQKSKFWKDTAIVLAYDDSDGWYDHQMSPIVNDSQDATGDALSGAGKCGSGKPAGGYQDRCGYGPRLPLMVISPYAKANHVDHNVTDQSSILRFVEDNWLHGQRVGDSSFDQRAGSLGGLFDFRHPNAKPFILDPKTGRPAA